jgi:hypothetical protein
MESTNENPGWQAGAGEADSRTERRNLTPLPQPPQQLRRIRNGTKFETIVRTLLARSDGLNRFQAESYGDHVLPSTVSSLRRTYGFIILAQDEAVPGRNDSVVHCSRYRFCDQDRELARELLGEAAS